MDALKTMTAAQHNVQRGSTASTFYFLPDPKREEKKRAPKRPRRSR